MFYRFIECYYKNSNIPNIKSSFLEYAFKNNYKKANEYDENKIEDFVYEMVSLRNHYAHKGYCIPEQKLYISYKKINEKEKNPKNHMVNNINIEWIYERTKILYDIVIDIIFNSMLGYEKYTYKKHF